MVLARYGKFRLLSTALLTLLIAVVSGLCVFIAGPIYAVFLGACAVALPIGSVRLAVMAFGDRLAIEQTAEGLVVHSNWRRHMIPWDEFVGPGVGEFTTSTLGVQTGSVQFVTLHRMNRDGSGSSVVKLVRKLLDLDENEMGTLLHTLERLARDPDARRTGRDAPSPAAPPTGLPPRPGFGRKVA